jgi:hypothetical protein
MGWDYMINYKQHDGMAQHGMAWNCNSFLVRRSSGIPADYGGARRIPRDCRTPPLPLRGRWVALSIHIVTNNRGKHTFIFRRRSGVLGAVVKGAGCLHFSKKVRERLQLRTLLSSAENAGKSVVVGVLLAGPSPWAGI